MAVKAAYVVVDGAADGPVLAADAPLSLWGGLDPTTGEIIDRSHPLSGEDVTGRVLVLPATRGSSASSAVLLEAITGGRGPAAVLLHGVDEVIAVGAIVGDELFNAAVPVLALDDETFATALRAERARVEMGGRITFHPSPERHSQ